MSSRALDRSKLIRQGRPRVVKGVQCKIALAELVCACLMMMCNCDRTAILYIYYGRLSFLRWLVMKLWQYS